MLFISFCNLFSLTESFRILNSDVKKQLNGSLVNKEFDRYVYSVCEELCYYHEPTILCLFLFTAFSHCPYPCPLFTLFLSHILYSIIALWFNFSLSSVYLDAQSSPLCCEFDITVSFYALYK